MSTVDSTSSSSSSVAPPADPAAYLSSQADHAAKAFTNTLLRLKETITSPLTLPPTEARPGSSDSMASRLLSEHPYVSLTGALASGFLAAAVFVPSKEQQVLKKLAALERAVALHGPDTAHPKVPGGLVGALMGSVASVVKPALLQMVTAALAARTASEVADAKTAESNGHATASSAPSAESVSLD